LNPFVVLIVCFVILVDVVVVWTIITKINDSCWKPISDKFPARERLFGQESGRLAWIFYIGFFKFGGSFRVLADEQGLHFTPTPVGKLLRFQPAFVPWESIEVRSRGRMLAKLKIDGKNMTLSNAVVPSPPAPA